MHEICDNLFVGTLNNCFYDIKQDWAVVHACKDPCHKYAVGYRGNLNNTHPNYLIKKIDSHLYLNMVDMNQILMHKFTEPIITTALDFIEKNSETKKVLIHCNQGQSRAPSLGLLFLAKRKGIISNESYSDAKNQFAKFYPSYLPGRGIEHYLTKYWNYLK